MKSKPMVMFLTMIAGWMNRQQQEIIEYVMAENDILREELQKATGKKRLILNDKQRRRLAILGKRLGRGVLTRISRTFCPDTLLKWHSKLVANKYDGSKHRGKGGRPPISDYLKQLIVDMAEDNKHLDD